MVSSESELASTLTPAAPSRGIRADGIGPERRRPTGTTCVGRDIPRRHQEIIGLYFLLTAAVGGRQGDRVDRGGAVIGGPGEREVKVARAAGGDAGRVGQATRVPRERDAGCVFDLGTEVDVPIERGKLVTAREKHVALDVVKRVERIIRELDGRGVECAAGGAVRE